MRTRLVPLVALMAAMLATLVFAGVAAAMCSTFNGSFHGNESWGRGWQADPEGGDCIDGSHANIQIKNPYVAAYDSSGWTMILNEAYGWYAQAGWIKDANGDFVYFYERLTGNGFEYIESGGVASPGTSVPFKVTVDLGSEFIYSWADGEALWVDGFWGETGYYGCQAAQAGEIKSALNQMPGATSSHMHITNSERHINNGGWEDFDGFAAGTHGPIWSRTDQFEVDILNANEADVWDDGCTT